MITETDKELLRVLIKVIDERINKKAQEAFNINDLFTDEMLSNLVDKVVLSSEFSNKIYDEVYEQLGDYNIEHIRDVAENIDDKIEDFVVNNKFALRRV